MTAPTADEPSKARGRRGGEPALPEAKALSTDEVVAALRRFRARGIAPVSRGVKR
jgi:hypothetical protein